MGVYPLRLEVVNYKRIMTYDQLIASFFERVDVDQEFIRRVVEVKDTLEISASIVDVVFCGEFKPSSVDRNRLVLTVNDLITDTDYTSEYLSTDELDGAYPEDEDEDDTVQG